MTSTRSSINDLQWMSQPIKKVAIVADAPSRRGAPWRDKSWEIWTLGRSKKRRPRIDRWFEMHSLPSIRAYRGNPKTKRNFREYWRYLKKLKCPVYMQRAHRRIPNSVRYPLEKVVQELGRCFTSSVSYMIGLAIVEGYEGIGCWGVDLATKPEYRYQRQAVQYLLAEARRRGIHVYIPSTSPLKVPSQAKYVRTKALYGYDWKSPHGFWNRLRKRRRKRRRLRLRRIRRIRGIRGIRSRRLRLRRIWMGRRRRVRRLRRR